MKTTEEFKKDLAIMVEAGLVAIKQGDEDSAQKLFDAAKVLEPASSAPSMGYGLIALHKMDIAGAKNYFLQILKHEEDNYRAKAFLAFTNVLSILQSGARDEQKIEGLREGARLAQEVLDKCREPSTRELAQSLLDWESELQKGK